MSFAEKYENVGKTPIYAESLGGKQVVVGYKTNTPATNTEEINSKLAAEQNTLTTEQKQIAKIIGNAVAPYANAAPRYFHNDEKYCNVPYTDIETAAKEIVRMIEADRNARAREVVEEILDLIDGHKEVFSEEKYAAYEKTEGKRYMNAQWKVGDELPHIFSEGNEVLDDVMVAIKDYATHNRIKNYAS